jgi:hypothetical protein
MVCFLSLHLHNSHEDTLRSTSKYEAALVE